MTSRWLLRLTGPLLAVNVACATNPATGKREFSVMSEEQEVATGRQNDEQIRKAMGVYEDRALQQYVSDVGLRLAQGSERPNLPWHFTVVDVPAINAFALPGGYIYITRGILPFLDDETQLAGVLGHEIGHVTARHAAQQYSRATGAGLGLILGGLLVPEVRALEPLAENSLGLLFLKYGRDDELQADELGVRYAARGGWDPAGVPRMLTTLGRIDAAADTRGVPNWLSTHPSPENRVERIQAAVDQAAQPGPRIATDRPAFQRRTDGLVYGDNPDQGVVRGHAFLHPKLRFAVDFPERWEITNGQTVVEAKQPGTNAFMLLQPVERAAERTVEDVASGTMNRAGFTPREAARTSINGLDAYWGTYDGSLQNVGSVKLRAAFIAEDRDVYMLLGVAPPTLFDRVEPDYSRSIRSFRALTRAEAEGVRPNRISRYTSRPGDTWESIAERQGKGVVKASMLAIMNGHDVGAQPQAGEPLKIVVGG